MLCPKKGVSTKECFAQFDAQSASGSARTEEAARLLSADDIPSAAHLFGNDLYPAAASLEEEVKTAVKELEVFSPLGASMTGSGSAAFAVFETRELAEWAKSRYRGNSRAYVLKSVDPSKKSKLSSPFALRDGEGQG